MNNKERIKKRTVGIEAWREIENLTSEDLMRTAIGIFEIPYASLDDHISQVLKRALVVRGLTSEEGAELLAKGSQRLSLLRFRKSRKR